MLKVDLENLYQARGIGLESVKPTSRVLDSYAEAGMKLVRLSREKKSAVDKGWPTKTLLLDDAHAWVNGGENIGIQCGEVSEWFCAVDLDVAEARALAGRAGRARRADGC